MSRRFSTFGPAALTLIALLAATAEARAGDPRNVVALTLPACATPPYDADDVLHALDLELAGDGLRAELDPGPSEQQLARVVVSLPECAPSADLLALELSSQRSPVVDRRSITLAKVAPPARARLLALVIAEALRPVLHPAPSHEHEAPSPHELDLVSGEGAALPLPWQLTPITRPDPKARRRRITHGLRGPGVARRRQGPWCAPCSFCF